MSTEFVCSDAPISEMSLELLLLQVILPAFLEQGHARKWLKVFIQIWVRVAASLLYVARNFDTLFNSITSV